MWKSIGSVLRPQSSTTILLLTQHRNIIKSFRILSRFNSRYGKVLVRCYVRSIQWTCPQLTQRSYTAEASFSVALELTTRKNIGSVVCPQSSTSLKVSGRRKWDVFTSPRYLRKGIKTSRDLRMPMRDQAGAKAAVFNS
jgi:hypothetical protein